MSDAPYLSLIIPVYNGAAQLPATFVALRAFDLDHAQVLAAAHPGLGIRKIDGWLWVSGLELDSRHRLRTLCEQEVIHPAFVRVRVTIPLNCFGKAIVE